MSNQPEMTRRLMQLLLSNRRYLRIGIFVLAIIFFAIPLVQMARQGMGTGLRLSWLYSMLMGLVCVAMGAIDLTAPTDEEETAKENRLRIELMLLGGILGLCTALFGFILPFTRYREVLAAGPESWRANPDALIWPGLAALGGLVVMFISVQFVRGLERQSQTIRRIVYGYNAVLMSMLLLAVLALPNILAYFQPFDRFFGRPFDWTASDINSISPLMRNYLADLREPIKVYMLLPRDNPIANDTQTLLENCKSLNSSKFSWEIVSPRSIENRDRIVGLMEKYSIPDPLGLLVIVGQEDEKTKPDFTFIKARDLYQEDAMANSRRGGGLSYSFLGENALYNALSTLTEGKMVIYFTTGHGEFGFDAGGMPPGMMPRARSGDLNKLRSRLTERKSVEVKPLALDRSTRKIPDDANIVVIARPTQAFTAEELKVLREYLQREVKTEKVKDASGREKEQEVVTSGKLMILLDPVIQKTGDRANMAPSGLEPLFSEYGVKMGNDRLLTVARGLPTPTQVIAITDNNSPNPVAKAFHPEPTMATLFQFDKVRSVEPLENVAGKRVDRLLIAPARFGLVVDTKFDVNPTDLVEGLRSDPERLEKAISNKSLSIAVAVSEGGTPPGMPPDAAHAGLLKDKPRMVVFGSAGWITDESLEGGRGMDRVNLFNSCLSWLRETSSIGAKIEAKKRKEYELNISPQEASRVVYLPLAMLVLGVVGLGTGVWVVRRR